jgi:hypothetical protein
VLLFIAGENLVIITIVFMYNKYKMIGIFMNTTTVDRFNVASDDLILEELVYNVKHDLGINIYVKLYVLHILNLINIL